MKGIEADEAHLTPTLPDQVTDHWRPKAVAQAGHGQVVQGAAGHA